MHLTFSLPLCEKNTHSATVAVICWFMSTFLVFMLPISVRVYSRYGSFTNRNKSLITCVCGCVGVYIYTHHIHKHTQTQIYIPYTHKLIRSCIQLKIFGAGGDLVDVVDEKETPHSELTYFASIIHRRTTSCICLVFSQENAFHLCTVENMRYQGNIYEHPRTSHCVTYCVY